MSGTPGRLIRRVVPYTLLPLSLAACVLANAPWLRAFPSGVMAVPLFGAALLSVVVPVIVVGIGVRRLWLSALIDLVLLMFFELIVTLREPAGYGHLWAGLVHGPAQILSFALPLVSPRTLLVAPVALCWISGALIGECVARGWHSVLPYLALIVTFGLSYAGTVRAVASSSDGRRYDTLLAGALLLTLLLLRAAQAWVVQDESAETSQPDGALPLRGLAMGTVVAVAVAAATAGLVQSSAFAGRPTTPARLPEIDQSHPLTPTAFVAGLRPTDPRSPGTPLFSMGIGSATSNYVPIGSVDYYDGDGWSFSRTFRPSGGVIPGDPDPAMHPSGSPVTQQYRILRGAVTSAPWMPFLQRPQRVTGLSVDIDPGSGMIVPTRALRPGDQYTVTSLVAPKTFGQLPKNALLGTSAAQVDTALANDLAGPLGTLVSSLQVETGASSSQPIPFLQAVAREFQTKDSLAGLPPTSSGSPSVSAGPTERPSSTHPRPSPTPTPTPTPTSTATQTAHTGGTTFADVLASI
ncbi:MAG TPA: hypothetical protein VKB75_08270, partial [Jatrophihabitans sp.]|nr:hypothetical protein [Jatrophihabitans sp.]